MEEDEKLVPPCIGSLSKQLTAESSLKGNRWGPARTSWQVFRGVSFVLWLIIELLPCLLVKNLARQSFDDYHLGILCRAPPNAQSTCTHYRCNLSNNAERWVSMIITTLLPMGHQDERGLLARQSQRCPSVPPVNAWWDWSHSLTAPAFHSCTTLRAGCKPIRPIAPNWAPCLKGPLARII